MTKQEFIAKAEKTKEVLSKALGAIRTNRANPALLEGLHVEYYGTKTPLVQLASITAPEPRLLVIQPWDKSSLKEIEAALAKSDLHLTGVNDGDVIRVQIPPLTEERRQEFVKLAAKRLEEAKIALRGIREEYIKALKRQESAGAISEDTLHASMKELQEEFQRFQDDFVALAQEKEKDLTTIT